MSNTLVVYRVKFQEINAQGAPVGEPTFGICASDNYESDYNNSYNTLEELNAAARETGCLLDLVGGFEDVDRELVGFENYMGPPRQPPEERPDG